LLTVTISPFYFASTGGLLGMFDNEPNFDLAAPSGQKLNDVASFVYAWEISEVKCSHENAYETGVDSRAQSACEALYQAEESAFRSCYPIVATDDFFAACMKSQGDFCKIAKAYQTTCNLKGALVSLPNECMSCADARGNNFQAGGDREYDVTSVDVVLIVQEGNCLSGKTKGKMLGKFMKKFTKSTISTFNSMGKSKTNFYIVGYGGPGGLQEAHTYTMRGGKVSTTKKSDITKRIKHTSLSREGAPSDGMDAIVYATKLPFRAGAQQVFIHLLCDSCSVDSAQSQEQVSSLLASRNIAYHHLPLKKIATSGKNSKPIYGYDNNRAYIKKGRNSNLAQIVQDDSNTCIEIATGSGGAVWDASNMKSGDFVNVFSHHIAENLPSVGGQTCSCQLDEFGEVVSKCVY